MIRINFVAFILMVASLGAIAQQEYRVLTLPGGGAFGVNELVALAQQEEDLGQPTYKTYDEIWAASIGSVIAALLTIPPKGEAEPMTAREALRFLQEELFGDLDHYDNFIKTAGLLNPLDLVNRLSAKIGWEPLMQDTLIPVSILAAEVKSFSYGVLPGPVLHTRISPERHPKANLIDAVRASCNIFGHTYMTTNTISGIGARYSNCSKDALRVKSAGLDDLFWPAEEDERCFIDSGLRGPMNPATLFEAPSRDDAVLYFIGNGWQEYERKGNFTDAQFINFKLKHDGHDVFGSWQKNFLLGRIFGNTGHLVKCNLAAAGLCSTNTLKQASDNIDERDDYKAMLKRLKNSEPCGMYKVSTTNMKKVPRSSY